MEFPQHVNSALGRSFGFSGLPGNQFVYFLLVVIFTTPLILPLGYFGYILTVAVVFMAWMAVTGEDPGKVKEKFYGPKVWRSFNPGCLDGVLPAPALPRVSYYLNKGVKYYWVEKNYQSLQTVFEYCIDGQIAAAYVHKRGGKVMITFGWRCAGHDPLATESMIKGKLQGMFDGVNSNPSSVELHVVNGSFIDDAGYIQQLRELDALPGLTAVEHLINAAKIDRVRKMTSPDVECRRLYGTMQSDFLYVYAKYRCTFAGGLSADPDRVEKFISEFFAALSFGASAPNLSDWDRVAKLAWDNCYKPISDILSSPTGLGFNIEPLDKDALFEVDYFASREHHDYEAESMGQYGQLRSAPEIPQYVPVYESGLGETVFNDDRHILGHLFASDYVPVPVKAQRAYVFSPALGKSGKYVGFLKVGMDRKVTRFPAIDGSDAKGSYLYVYNALRNSGIPFHDYKIHWQWSEIDTALPATNLDRRLAGATRREADATKRGTVSIQAKNDFEASYEARDMIDKGHRVGWCSFVLSVYRDSVDELSVALSDLKRRFPSGNPSIAEEVCQEIWHQTAPYAWEMLLTLPEHRCQQYFSSEAFRMMPFVSGPRLDDRGIMLLHRLFRSPIYLDIIHKRPNHTVIIAETGEGKSILLLDFIFQYLCYSLPLIVFEFPRSDGRSTYSDLIEWLRICGKKVVYLDVKKQKFNFLGRPNLSHLDDENPAQKQKKKDALQDTIDQQIDILTSIVVGANPGTEEKDVKDLMTQLFYAWLSQPSVIADYEVASSSLFGSQEYKQMPNLEQLVEFATQSSLDSDYPDAKGWLALEVKKNETLWEGSRRAIDKISQRLSAILYTPLGRSLNGPSTFDISADLIVLSLTDVSSNDDSLTYALLGLQVIYQKSAVSQSSGAIVEEATTLLKMPAFGRKIEAMPVTARRQGMNVTFAFQLIGDVSPSLFGNIQNVILGGTTEATVNQVVDVIGFDRDIANLCVSQKKNVKKIESYWVLKRGTQYIPLTHVPPKLLLFLGATDTLEVDMRHRCWRNLGNPGDPTDIRWMVPASNLYAEALQSGQSMNTIFPEVEAVCV
jgi:hypothetical protein